jgi:amidase
MSQVWHCGPYQNSDLNHVIAKEGYMKQSKITEGPRPYGDLWFWISFATHTGLPATVVPVGLTREGLPVGMQIIGPYLEDATPIDVAAKIEEILGGFRPPKGF